MTKRQPLQPITREGALALFQRIDLVLQQRQQQVRATLLGGLAIILHGIRDRSTLDIDIAPSPDADVFAEVCRSLKIPVDIITIASTVDLQHAPTTTQFSGAALQIEVITPRDLIKLKLERFFKQDPEDIFAIIGALSLPYHEFLSLVQEMLLDFIGNPRGVILSAGEVVERMYPEHVVAFTEALRRGKS